MPFHDIQQLAAATFFPGFVGRPVHSGGMTVMHWTIEAGAAIPDHKHLHEQLTYVLDGEFEITVDGETRVIRSGQFVLIPSWATHGGHAVTPCAILDVFVPEREDYKL